MEAIINLLVLVEQRMVYLEFCIIVQLERIDTLSWYLVGAVSQPTPVHQLTDLHSLPTKHVFKK